MVLCTIVSDYCKNEVLGFLAGLPVCLYVQYTLTPVKYKQRGGVVVWILIKVHNMRGEGEGCNVLKMILNIILHKNCAVSCITIINIQPPILSWACFKTRPIFLMTSASVLAFWSATMLARKNKGNKPFKEQNKTKQKQKQKSKYHLAYLLSFLFLNIFS